VYTLRDQVNGVHQWISCHSIWTCVLVFSISKVAFFPLNFSITRERLRPDVRVPRTRIRMPRSYFSIGRMSCFCCLDSHVGAALRSHYKKKYRLTGASTPCTGTCLKFMMQRETPHRHSISKNRHVFWGPFCRNTPLPLSLKPGMRRYSSYLQNHKKYPYLRT